MAEELTAKDVIKAHARDELGIDLDEMSNPLQVSQDVLHSASLRHCCCLLCAAMSTAMMLHMGFVRCHAHGFHGLHPGSSKASGLISLQVMILQCSSPPLLEGEATGLREAAGAE